MRACTRDVIAGATRALHASERPTRPFQRDRDGVRSLAGRRRAENERDEHDLSTYQRLFHCRRRGIDTARPALLVLARTSRIAGGIVHHRYEYVQDIDVVFVAFEAV